MKKLIGLLAFVCVSLAAQAQYTYTDTGLNGNKLAEGQYSANPGLLPNDSKEDMARKLAAVHKTGTWKYWFENGKLAAEEHYTSAGLQMGVWKTWYINGQLATEVDYVKNTAVYYHDNGTKSSEGKISGMLQVGDWKGWHSNGQLNFTGSYDSKGLKQGVWKFWNADGSLMGTENWNHGTAVK